MGAHRRILRFGRFEFDRDDGSLRREGRPLDLPALQHAVLAVFLDRPGRIITRDELIAIAWAGRAISEDALNKMIDRVRAFLRSDPGCPLRITAVRRRGFRLDGLAGAADLDAAHTDQAADRGAPPAGPDEPLDVRALLSDQITIVTQRAALESFDGSQVAAARTAFAELVARTGAPSAAALVGFANALVLEFEATRASATRDRSLLVEAERCSLEALRLAPDSPEPWGVLATTYHHLNRRLEAIAAARKAVALEPGDGTIQQRLRLAYVAGGNERLAAANHVIDRAPGIGIAHWLAATVFVARGVLHLALERNRHGCVIQDQQGNGARLPGPLAVTGLHLQRGLILNAMGQKTAARDAYEHELSFDASPLHAREARANTHYALAALALEHGHAGDARRHLQQACEYVSGHGPATQVLRYLDPPVDGAAGDPAGPWEESEARDPITAAVTGAIALGLRGRHAEAAGLVLDVWRESAGLGPGGGWLLPIEPILYQWMERPEWSGVRERLRQLSS